MNAVLGFSLSRAGCAGLAVLALLGGLAGCASRGAGLGGDAGGIITPADESETRRRARTRLALAAGYFENKQTAVALGELKQVLQIDPNFGPAYNLGGLIYMSLGDLATAESQFQRAIALNARDGNALHNLGWLYCQQKRYDAAVPMFERALANPLYPERAKTLMAQGICEARGGDRAKAEATLLRSYELDAGNPVTGFNLAQLLYMRGDYERARFYIRRLNNSELANAESLWLGIRVERRLNNAQAMRQLGEQLRRRFPQSSELVAYERGRFDD